MTNSVSLSGLFAPSAGARDAKVNEDNTLASFAGMLAGVNQANAKLNPPTPQPEGATTGDELEKTEDGKTADDSKDGSAVVATTAADVAGLAATTTNPNAINNSIAALNPALQEKLARVISRMRDEAGHDVQVTETYRTQSRQNALYAQGRDTAGPVVTWTQHSKHTQGRAVDVTLDGGRASADAYTTLQRIANEEGLRTLGAKDPGHIELPSTGAATSQALNDAISVLDEPADASGPGQISVARLAQIAKVATVEHVSSVGSDSPHTAKLSPTTYMRAIKAAGVSATAAPAHVARVASLAQVATIARVASDPPAHRGHVIATGATRSKHQGEKHQGDLKQASSAPPDETSIADGLESPKPEDFMQLDTIFAQADGAADSPDFPRDDSVSEHTVAGADVTIGDATGESRDDLPTTRSASTAATSAQTPPRPKHNAFEISNLERLSDAVNATRVEDGSPLAQANAAQSASKKRSSANDAGVAKTRMAPRAQAAVGMHTVGGQTSRAAQSQATTGSAQFSAATISRSSNSSQEFSSDRQSSQGDATGYTPMPLRTETSTHFSVADVSTEMTSTASQRAERIMAAQDAPARPLSQIVMSVDAGNGAADRIQVALRGSTVSATIDVADHHTANAMRAHSDDLVRSLTRDGVDVDSLRVRTTAATTAAPVTTVDSSQKSSDSSSNSRFNRDAQWDQQRNQQRSNSERRNQQRDQRGGKD